jgi:thiamine pyrophosphate-dependent acetolactate synthase large subunit-like protein
MVIITGQVPTAAIGQTRSRVRHRRHHAAVRQATLVKNVADIALTTKGVLPRDNRAPGPVLVDIPKDIRRRRPSSAIRRRNMCTTW